LRVARRARPVKFRGCERTRGHEAVPAPFLNPLRTMLVPWCEFDIAVLPTYAAPVKPAVVNVGKEWTEAELEALPEDGYIHEVVNGELVMSPKNYWYHGRICTRLITAISIFVREHRLGAVLDSSTGFWMCNRNCRAPDVSFVPKSRLESLGFKPSERRFFPGAPDLAIEILSPNNTRIE